MPKADRRTGDVAATDHGVRFDRWLWAARLYRTRGLAAKAIAAGQARYAGERVKPAQRVRAGDAIAIRKQGIVREITVSALSDRRGGATDAAKLYRETPESAKAREEDALRRRGADAAQPRFPGRPSKRQRRKLEDFLCDP
jgi:ribosome-associated heat shock protein Hsp15